MTNADRPLLFVNKDAANIAHRSSDEAFAVSSHVTKRYVRWSRKERVRCPSNKFSTISSSQSETESRNKTSDAPDVQRDESRQTTASCMPGSSNSLAEELLLQTHPSPVTMLQHGNSDPFSMSSVEITPTNHYLVKYWQEVLVQTVVPSEILSTASISVISCDDENFDMIGHPERLHFLLAWAQMLQVVEMPASENKRRLEVEALAHKVAGLASLQKSIATMSKITAIRAIWHLVGAEFYSGDLVAASFHSSAMENLVILAGGVSSLPWKLSKLVVVSDIVLSTSTNKPAAFDVDEWDPGSVISILSICEVESLAVNPLIQESLSESIPPRFIQLFISYRELLAVHQIAADVGSTSQSTALPLWAQLRQYALGTRVMNIKADLDLVPTSPGILIDKAVCVALGYLMQMLWFRSQTKVSDATAFHHAQNAFEILRQAAQLESSSLMLWVLFVAATIELIMRQRGQAGSWFAERFADMLEDLKIHSLRQAQQILSQLLYSGEIFDLYLRALVSPLDGISDADSTS